MSVSEHLFALESNSVRLSDVARAHDVTDFGWIFDDGTIGVKAVGNTHFSTMHLTPQPYGTDSSFSYRFESKDRTIAFTGDTGPSEDVVQMAQGADVLVSEVVNVAAATRMLKSVAGLSKSALASMIAHMSREHRSPADVGDIAQRAGVKLVVLTHLSLGMDSETDPTVYSAGVRARFSGPVVVGRDLDEF
jgi:ribonuclease BN (tRNA processing enzyme)